MSTPEEQQQQQQQQQQHHGDQQGQQDPYGTQTWQADTWDTGYQPVQPPLGAVPGQPVAPEGWFRDEAPAVSGSEAPAPAGVPWPGAPAAEAYPSYPAPQAPQGEEAGAGGPWPDGTGAGSAPGAGPGVPWPEGPAVEAYPSYQDPQYQQAPAGQPAAPEGWFRDEVRAPAPAQDWSQGDGSAYAPPASPASPAAPASAAETAYLPPYPGPDPQAAPAHHGFGQQQPAAPAAAEETAYLPPYQDGPGAQAQAAVPEGWFRDEVPAQAPAQASAPAPAQDWSQGAGTAVSAAETAYLPPYPGPAEQQPEAAAEQTAYLPPQAAAPAPTAEPVADGPADGPADDSAWSPPTLGGNTLRAVDPAQARAEGRSPIIDPGPQSAILTAALGLLMALAAFLGQYAVLVPLVALQALTAAGWFRLNGMWPARQGIALAFAGALVADVAVLAVDDTYAPGAIIGTLGAWVLVTLVLQLRSHADPDERMYGLMASVASAALAVVCAGWLAADTAAVSVGAVAVAVAVFTRALPLPTAPSVAVALASAAGAGLVVGGLTDVGAGGALVGLVAGVCALIGLRVAAYDYPSKFVHMTAGVALPLAVAAPAVYLIGRVVS
ncbi:hypothetical protein ACFCV9_24895 [Streptomyces sp. NPDC056367]|uniref:hypothetical protein n=1 Tax=Streptomyces sp. NPDC056367 TaxID=3345797 RepID=UPI0035D9BA2A